MLGLGTQKAALANGPVAIWSVENRWIPSMRGFCDRGFENDRWVCKRSKQQKCEKKVRRELFYSAKQPENDKATKYFRLYWDWPCTIEGLRGWLFLQDNRLLTLSQHCFLTHWQPYNPSPFDSSAIWAWHNLGCLQSKCRQLIASIWVPHQMHLWIYPRRNTAIYLCCIAEICINYFLPLKLI